MRLIRICITLLFMCFLLFSSIAHAQESASDIRLPIIEDSKLGYIDGAGKVVIEPQFCENKRIYLEDHVFSEGLARVFNRVGGITKWGYIDKSGAFVIEPQFISARDFSEGLAWVVRKGKHDNEWGCIDETGKLIIDFQSGVPFGDFKNGLTLIQLEGGTKRYINKSGSFAFNAKFADSEPFSEGLAAVRHNGSLFNIAFSSLLKKDIPFNYGYINKLGRVLIKPNFAGAAPFSEGLAAVQVDLDLGKFRFGYINREGKMVIKPQFKTAESFSEGLAAVAVYYSGFLNWGFIDKSGEFAIEPQFSGLGPFSENLAAAGYWDKGKHEFLWGYIDKTGQFVIKPRFIVLGDFKNGYAFVEEYDSMQNNKSGYIDKSGNYILEPAK